MRKTITDQYADFITTWLPAAAFRYIEDAHHWVLMGLAMGNRNSDWRSSVLFIAILKLTELLWGYLTALLSNQLQIFFTLYTKFYTKTHYLFGGNRDEDAKHHAGLVWFHYVAVI